MTLFGGWVSILDNFHMYPHVGIDLSLLTISLKQSMYCKCLMINMYQATYDFIASKNTPVLSKFSFRLILDLEHLTLWEQAGFSCKMIYNQICMVDVHYKMANNRQKSFLFCYMFINCRPLNTKKMCILQTNNLF